MAGKTALIAYLLVGVVFLLDGLARLSGGEPARLRAGALAVSGFVLAALSLVHLRRGSRRNHARRGSDAP